MKTFLLSIFALPLLTVTAAQAEWKMIITCNQGELTVDQETNDQGNLPNYQMVLRGKPLDYFVQQAAVDHERVNEKNEFVLPMQNDDTGLKGVVDLNQKQKIYWVQRTTTDVTVSVNFSGQSASIANWAFHGCTNEATR